jgi:ferrous iron transport protein A
MSDLLKDLKVGEKAEIIGFNEGDPSYKKKLLSFGLTPGVELKVVRVAPLGDPVQIEVRGFQLSLRKNEANILQIRKLS